jgi:hypothetical protein
VRVGRGGTCSRDVETRGCLAPGMRPDNVGGVARPGAVRRARGNHLRDSRAGIFRSWSCKIPLLPSRSISTLLDCYWRIHALPGRPPEEVRARDPASLSCPASANCSRAQRDQGHVLRSGAICWTIPRAGRAWAELAADGHELANSQLHPSLRIWSATHRPRSRSRSIAPTTPSVLVPARRRWGFRRARLHDFWSRSSTVCGARGYRYDSSAFPALPYYAAKALVMAAMFMRTAPPAGAYLGSAPRPGRRPPSRITPRRAPPYRGAATCPSSSCRWPSRRCCGYTSLGPSLVTFPEWLRRRMWGGGGPTPVLQPRAARHRSGGCRADGFPTALVARQPDLRRVAAGQAPSAGRHAATS